MSLVGGWQTLAPTSTPEANPHLYVHNVPKDSNEEELRSVFGQYGTVANVRLKVNQKVGPYAVYAFVTFNSTEEARNALVNLQGKDIRGRSLRIEFQRAAATPAAMQQQFGAQRAPAQHQVLRSSPYSSMEHQHIRRQEQSPVCEPFANNPPYQAGGVRYVAANDHHGLVEAMRQLLILQRPDLLDAFQNFCDSWSAALPQLAKHIHQPAPWPVSHLSNVQQRLASEGNLELDTETGRWGVLLNKLIHPANTPSTNDGALDPSI